LILWVLEEEEGVMRVIITGSTTIWDGALIRKAIKKLAWSYDLLAAGQQLVSGK
jgi:hypothetical protein